MAPSGKYIAVLGSSLHQALSSETGVSTYTLGTEIAQTQAFLGYRLVSDMNSKGTVRGRERLLMSVIPTDTDAEEHK